MNPNNNTFLIFLVLSFYILTFNINGFSQIEKGGLVAGINASQIYRDSAIGYHQYGFILGGQVDIRVTDYLSFSPNLLVEQLGSSRSQGNIILKANYFSLPLFLRLNPRIEANPLLDKLSLDFALVLGVLLSAKDRFGDFPSDLTAYDLRSLYGISFRMEKFGFFFRLGKSISRFTKADPYVFRNRTKAHVYVSMGTEIYLYGRYRNKNERKSHK